MNMTSGGALKNPNSKQGKQEKIIKYWIVSMKRKLPKKKPPKMFNLIRA